MASTTLSITISAVDQASKVLRGLGSSLKGLGSAVSAPAKAVGGLTEALGKVGLAGIGVKALADAAGGLGDALGVNLASDINESMSKVGVVFGDASKEIESFAATSARSFGLSKAEALATTGTFGNLFRTIGLGQKEAADMSVDVAKLGADLASFHNLDTPEVLEKIRSGLAGESEPLRSLGVFLTEASVQAKAMELGLADANGEVSEAGKVQARYALILEQTKAAQGDFARTSTGMANAQRIIGASFEDLRATVGEKLLPVIAPLVSQFAQALPGAIDAAKPALDTLGQVIGTVGAFLTGPVLDGVKTFIGAIQGDWEPAPGIGQFAMLLGVIGTFLREQVIPAVQTFGEIIGKVLNGDVSGALDQFGQLITDVAPMIIDTVGEWASAFLSFIGPMIPGFVDELGKLSVAVLEWLGKEAVVIVEHLAPWAAAFIDFVAPMIPPLLMELGKILLAITTWLITTALPAILSKLAEWGLAFIEWIAPRIGPMLAELLKLEARLLLWIATEALPAIIEKLKEWGAAFLDWIKEEVLPRLGEKLKEVGTALTTWISDQARALATAAVEMGKALVRGIIDGLGDLASQLKEAITNAVKALLPIHIGPITIGAGGVRVDMPDLNPFDASAARAASASAASSRGMSAQTINFYTTNTIDARGQQPSAITKAVGDDLATLARRRVSSGAVA